LAAIRLALRFCDPAGSIRSRIGENSAAGRGSSIPTSSSATSSVPPIVSHAPVIAAGIIRRFCRRYRRRPRKHVVNNSPRPQPT
jgi:hypothetical protein